MVRQWIISIKALVYRHTGSLVRKLILLLMNCTIISILFFAILYLGANAGLDYFLEHSSYLEQARQKALSELQAYVTKNALSSADKLDLSTWVKDQKIVYLEVYQNNHLLYASTPHDLVDFDEIDSVYYKAPHDTLTFTDGEADVILWGLFGYQFYNYTLIAELLLSFVLFLFLFIRGLKHRIQYIQTLQSDIEIMEGGCLEKPVTVLGNDELADLADGLEQLRLSFWQNIQNENVLNRANQTLITGVAHDLRTPLTALTMYVQILQSDVCENEETKQYYLEKIMSKAALMKSLSDRLFECSQISDSDQEPLVVPQTLQDTFMDYLSEMAMYLGNQGFQIEAELEWRTVSLLIRMDYIARIIDNIGDNLTKYADPTLPILLKVIYTNHMAGFEVRNRIRMQTAHVESTKVGIKNIRRMIKQMHGTCHIEMEQDYYKICILFPIQDS